MECLVDMAVTAMVVAVLLGIDGFDMNRGAEMTVVDTDIDIQKSDMGGGSVPGEVDGIPTVELLTVQLRPSTSIYEVVSNFPIEG